MMRDLRQGIHTPKTEEAGPNLQRHNIKTRLGSDRNVCKTPERPGPHVIHCL